MPDAEILPRQPLPAFESGNYLTVFILCHHRLQALHRIAEGRECPHDDRSMITGCEEILARRAGRLGISVCRSTDVRRAA
jgi:hypothetical protein